MKKSIAILCGLMAICVMELNAQPEPVSRMYITIEQYYSDIQSLNRANQLQETPEHFDRMEVFYTDWLSRLESYDYEKLNTGEAVDFILLRRNIRRDLKELRKDRSTFEEVRHTVQFADIIKRLQAKRRVGNDLNGKAFANQLNELVKAIRENKRAVEKKGRLEPQQADRAVEVAENLHETLEHIFEFYNGYDPDVTWWAEKSYRRADSTFAGYIDFLRN